MEPQNCRRCDSKADIVYRTEPLCQECFLKFLRGKMLKRTEAFRVRGKIEEGDPQRRLLLPLSFGVSSMCLLDMIDRQRKRQLERTGRSAFVVEVVHVDESDFADETNTEKVLASIVEMYPDNGYHSTKLSEAFDRDVFETFGRAFPESSCDSHSSINELMQSLSATSRSDLSTLLRDILIVKAAEEHRCTTILWADSATRLAEKTLSETAKGRGFALPWTTGDGQSPCGVDFLYPCRDITRTELTSYAEMTSPSLLPVIWTPVSSNSAPKDMRNASIDALIGQYFGTVEKDYPSVVANVVRTTAKLRSPPVSARDARCQLCRMPFTAPQAVDDTETISHRSDLCYGCQRTVPSQDQA